MKILVTQNKVLDTIEGKILTNISEYDREHLQTNIIYNIHIDINTKIKLCSLYSCKKEDNFFDMPYESTISKFNQAGAPYQIISLEDESQQKQISSQKPQKTIKQSKQTINKSIEVLRKILQINVEYNQLVEEVKSELDLKNNKLDDTQVLFSKDLSNAERDKIKEQNLINEIAHQKIYVDADLSKALDNEGMAAARLIEQAMKTLYNKNRFYYSLLDSLNVKFLNAEESIKEDVKTMAVSATTLYICNEFVLRCRPKELVFILCHEALHIMLNHHDRLLSRNAAVYNIAGDTIINSMLAEELGTTPSKEGNYAEFAHGGIYYPKYDIKVETADSIYDKIIKENPNLVKQIEDYYNNLDKIKGPDAPGGNNGSQPPSATREEEIPPELRDGQGGGQQGPTASIKNTNQLYEVVQKIFDTMTSIKEKLNDPQNASVKAQAQAKLIGLENKIKKIGKIVDLEQLAAKTKRIYSD